MFHNSLLLIHRAPLRVLRIQCATACAVLCIALLLPQLASAQVWSPWLNRSTPSAAGELETIAGFTADGTMPCTTPLAIQCRDKLIPSKVIVNSTGMYTCDTVTGGRCLLTAAKGCRDMEVRFQCAPVKLALSSVVNGACGTGLQTASVTTTAQFAAMHCTTGTLTNLVSSTNPITWSCAGGGGGTTVACSKPGEGAGTLPVGGCGTANGVATLTPPSGAALCGRAVASVVSVLGTGFAWTCTSPVSGVVTSCSTP